MPAFASVEFLTGIKYSEQPLATPDQAEGEEGRKLLELFTKIVADLREQPPRSFSFPMKEGLEEDTKLISRNQAAIGLLRAWREGDEAEQRETWDYLKQALDEDRLSNRKLFK